MTRTAAFTLADSILNAEILEPGPIMPACYPLPPVLGRMPAASPVPAPSPEPSSSGQSSLAPLLLVGGGVAALGMACVFGLVILVVLAAALDDGSSGGASYARSGGGSFEDNTSSFMAEHGGSYNGDLNGVGRVNYGD